ncbi:bifunctional ADP-dependent NAD(P)H-hydrate dehydratase/NAD(P)H-hydrate epimerase [Aliarcobacter cryaerophilus ATCC 43158]|uniref:Bifunctional NAD(P)H-hydrate repair enzyme n=1 Tax=Aliarcobacter cryaerophilus ATCC 43158 TaxID=1032070 RepID=A0AAD0XB39_9BACT|nr:NAD(P)H-hydrate dehydratase [Aliarcobacter cryaerophilus]AYJ80906.1 carbohydrate kinase, YjeF-related protein [Aliarcobacter cryaerophilus ATCC 43158]PRM98399.1 bifunctional ADP-dependent NAD(P)H-hydrate dehydratase/NAD(P)H-hydrate epimerase [Aliarcobacter cryaerophilus]QCZ23231.1 bifunctional ADP-dependent NAD(P)H-hydrate dehydratase/NAD(P)H-hydrate epimerase [Aliarcobacter cryaerophilus ATCC 43158]
MKKIFDEVRSLDKRAIEEFHLTEDILMENASLSLKNYITKKFKINSSILIVCGSGNNGADGLALARHLFGKFEVFIYLSKDSKTKIGKLQEKRVKSIGVNFVNEIFQADIIVDCLFGTGLNKELDENSVSLINSLNSFNSFKIACDIPSGLNSLGQVIQTAFKADITITMGALKTALLSDIAKDFVGKIKVATLGIENELFQAQTNKYLLEKSDLVLPLRDIQNTHKGIFGHLNIICGDKIGASIIASNAAFIFGAGLVTIICKNDKIVPSHIMQSKSISENCTAIALGMGLGEFEALKLEEILKLNIPKVLDADIFYNPLIVKYLDENIVLTPHPKEFISLLKLTNIADISIKNLQENRFLYVEKFCKIYPKVTLLLKGANVIISQNNNMYINTFGSQKLSKGGSGDILTGLISSLLAQGYKTLEATICGSLAHALASKNYKKNNYSLTPKDLIKEIKKL